jgi:TPR repeat protein
MEVQNDASTSKSTAEAEFRRVKLKVVVQACEKRWFEEYLAEAEQGDKMMQLIVGKMFQTGYGVERDPSKVMGF